MYLKKIVTGGYSAAYDVLRILLCFFPTTLWLKDSRENAVREESTPPSHSVKEAHTSPCNAVFVLQKAQVSNDNR